MSTKLSAAFPLGGGQLSKKSKIFKYRHLQSGGIFSLLKDVTD
jgi:hypothetical protein